MKKFDMTFLAAIAAAPLLLLAADSHADDYEVNNALCSECADQDDDWRRYRNAAIQQCLSVPAEVPAYQVFGVDPTQIQQCRQMVAYQLVNGLSDRIIIDVCPSGELVAPERRHLCVNMQIQIEWETGSFGVDFVILGFDVTYARRPIGVDVISRSPDGTTYDSGYSIYFPDGVLAIPGGWPPTDPELLPYTYDDGDDGNNDNEGDDAGDDDGPSGDESEPPGPPEFEEDEEGDDECWEC